MGRTLKFQNLEGCQIWQQLAEAEWYLCPLDRADALPQPETVLVLLAGLAPVSVWLPAPDIEGGRLASRVQQIR